MSLARPKIAIIVLNWNGKQDTLACLESLAKLIYLNFEVIIVDNGSTDGSAAAIRKDFPKFLLIENDENYGFAEGNNIGMRKAMQRGAELFFLLNNDTIVAADILDRFVEMFDSRPEAGILGAKIYLFEQKQTIDHLGGIWNSKTATFEFIGKHQTDNGQWQNPQELDYVCGAGLILTRKVIDAIGYLDPRFFLIWEESDYCFRSQRAGFKVFTCPGAKIWHKVSASFVGGKPHSTYFWWRNRLLWIEKNCSSLERINLYLRVLIPDILHMLKIHLIKSIQLKFIELFKLKKNVTHIHMVQNLASGNVSASDLQQAQPLLKQDICKHISDAESCKDEDAGATNGQILNYDVYMEKKEKLIKNRAALCGVRDYLMRRFGKGPVWIQKNTQKLFQFDEGNPN